MKNIVFLLVLACSTPTLAQANLGQSDFRNFFGSAALGAALGVAGGAVLLIKDATVGVVVKGGNGIMGIEFWGKERVLPLAFVVLVPALATGIAGYKTHINWLEQLLLGVSK